MKALRSDLVHAGERLCLAVSGGADSVALLRAMVELNARKESLGVVLGVAHVHHGLRGEEADGDEAFVRGLCQELAVPLTVFRVDTAERQADAGEGIEEAARALRYERLWSLLAEGKADVVATAHTRDDQAETVMMKLLRGAWTEGLGGISPMLRASPGTRGQPAAPGRIVRPLLEVRRAELETYLKALGQAWREDASNADARFTRNRVRHELMPVLRSYNPGLDELLARTAEVARDEEAYWQAEVARLLPQLVLPGTPVRGGGRAAGAALGVRALSVELTRLRALPAALQRRVLRAMALELGARLTGEETARLMALAGLGRHPTVEGRSGLKLELRGGLGAERSARELRLASRFGVGKAKT